MMIEINLLPEDLKSRGKTKMALPGPGGFPIDRLLFLIPLLFALLICGHIYLAVVNIAKQFHLHTLNNKWQQLESQRKIVDSFSKESEVLSADRKVVEELTSGRANWSDKLNKLSQRLPNGIWFNELSLTQKNFILRGSAVSLQKEELSLINIFIDSLKKDGSFFKDFNSLELGSIQRRVIAGYDVVDFVLTGNLK